MGVSYTRSLDNSYFTEWRNKLENKSYIGKGLATIGVCAMGAFCMYISNGTTGIGWAILGVLLIWGA
jgi:hypothetical protein